VLRFRPQLTYRSPLRTAVGTKPTSLRVDRSLLIVTPFGRSIK
jgi:hypothetical protein